MSGPVIRAEALNKRYPDFADSPVDNSIFGLVARSKYLSRLMPASKNSAKTAVVKTN